MSQGPKPRVDNERILLRIPLYILAGLFALAWVVYAADGHPEASAMNAVALAVVLVGLTMTTRGAQGRP